MTCPPEIATCLLRILQTGLLRARAAAWEGDAEHSAREIDHLHNLPALVAEFSPERLNYYWETERPVFEESCAKASINTATFGPLWQQLQCQMEIMMAAGRAD